MNDQLQSLLRTILQLIAGFLVTKGVGSQTVWESVIGGIISAVGLFLSWRNAQQKTKLANQATVLVAVTKGTVAQDHPAVKDIQAETPHQADDVVKSLAALEPNKP